MTKKTTPKSKAPRAKTAAAKKTTAEKKLELEAEVATEAKASEVPAEEPREEPREDNRPQESEPMATGIETSTPEARQQHRGSVGLVGWLALVLALSALSATAFLVFDDWRTGSSEQKGEAALAGLAETLDATRDSLNDLEPCLEPFFGHFSHI